MKNGLVQREFSWADFYRVLHEAAEKIRAAARELENNVSAESPDTDGQNAKEADTDG
jgi:hypothetical protein